MSETGQKMRKESATESYDHPRQEVLEELQAAKISTFRTDINGVTWFRLDGKNVAQEPLCGWR
jgi:beta-lactamase superfamily II metal-dependent hydrolase